MSLKGKAEGSFEVKGRLTALDYILMTAYGVALKNGFEGTEEEWLESLVGPAPSEEQILAALTEYFKDNPEGILYTPSVDANGNLSWTNNAGKANPATVNIKGPKGSDAAVTKANIQKALGYTPANDADLGNKLDAYIITGVHTEDEYGRHAALDDSFSWDDMVAAINANKYVGCVLRDESGEYPIYLTLGGAWIDDGYAVFTALDEDGWVSEMYIYADYSVNLRNYWLASAEYVDSAVAAVGSAKIQTGSYVGTGSASADSPCQLTFEFAPILVFIVARTSPTSSVIAPFGYSSDVHPYTYLPLLDTTGYRQYGFVYTANNAAGPVYAKKSSDGKTLYWYNPMSEQSSYDVSYNKTGKTYYWVAIG